LAEAKHAMTRRNLEDAYSGESQAHMRYLIFAEVAEKEGKPNIARLFRAIAFAEQVHAANHYRVLGKVGSTSENLDMAIGGETFEVEEMYPVYNNAEKIHAKMYTQAKEAALQGRDLEIGDVYICPVCGYTVEGSAPDHCPVCGAPKSQFKAF